MGSNPTRSISFLYGFIVPVSITMVSSMQISPIDNQQNFHVDIDPYSKFMYAIESPETKRRYPQRFKTFLDYLKISGDTIEGRINIFYENAVAICCSHFDLWLIHFFIKFMK
ncbi:MAG TPA: hypothetical protein VJP58_11045 [Candidatus Nitrosocosmicus sp.]|nr:hypothetical protein [Candidatus Nitrosocosmicus sp.]